MDKDSPIAGLTDTYRPKVLRHRARPLHPPASPLSVGRASDQLIPSKPAMRQLLASLAVWGLLATTSVLSAEPESTDVLAGPWPAPLAVQDRTGERFAFASSNPFSLSDVARSADVVAPAGTAVAAGSHSALGLLFLPDHADPARPSPAVVLLHGARGVSQSREITYARQLAELGVAALVIDVFASRRDRATGFTDRLLEITEAMALADAFGALKALGDRPEIDAERIALIGFSYGGMSAIYAAHAQVFELYAARFALSPERRFRAHVAYYAPCIARFDRIEATGAPVLMMWGDQDEIIDPEACAAVAADLRAGGTTVRQQVFAGAYHQWDGNLSSPWRAPRGLADCDFRVRENAEVVGRVLGLPFHLPMDDVFSRKLLLGLCSDTDGYLIGRNLAVRDRSNRALAAFLRQAFRK